MTPAAALRMVADHPSTFTADFGDWLRANLHVWHAFAREASRVWARGRRHYSARTIIEVLRHESLLSETDGAWKLNNNCTRNLARLYLLTHPDHSGLFELRNH